jgi:hypothetical protein
LGFFTKADFVLAKTRFYETDGDQLNGRQASFSRTAMKGPSDNHFASI